jgi:ribonuclease BN (tRNA processing enzyme)
MCSVKCVYTTLNPRVTTAKMSRRSFLGGSLALTAGVSMNSAVRATNGRTRLILLGTGGGPRPRKASSAPAQVIVVNDAAYVVDCGDGVARQLVMANVPLANLKSVFITHHHSDHNADYGNLILLAWTAGLSHRVDTWGPPPLQRMTRLFFEMNSYDIKVRIADEGRPPLVPLVHAHEVRTGGVVMQDENVKVTAALAHHPPVSPAFGYRFDTKDRSIVISGDTTPTKALIELAQGADVLVHDALFEPAIDRMVARVPNAQSLKQSILSHHTSAEDAGRVAREAGVKMLVLSHLIPADDPEVTAQMWMDAARRSFDGEIVVGRDLMEI